MQLPLQQAGYRRVVADGVLQDYVTTRLYPCTPAALARLLARLHRYGVHAGPLGGTDVLTHSMHVARVVERLAQHAALSGPNRAMLSLYARLHDIGELFGGEVNALVPATVIEPFRAWQRQARTAMQQQMGLPLPPSWCKPLLKLADQLVVPSEIVTTGGLSAASMTLEGALEETETTTGLHSAIQTTLGRIPELSGRTVLELVREAHGITPGGDLHHAFAAFPSVYLTVKNGIALFAWKNAEETRRVLLEDESGADTVVATAPLRSGKPADVYLRDAFLRSFPRTESP